MAAPTTVPRSSMADDVWNWCDKAQAFGRTVTVKVKFADFRQITRSKSFASVVRTQELLRQTSRELIGLVLPPEKGIRLVGVTVSNFETEPGGAEALPLFGSNGELEAHPPGNFG